MTETRNDDRCAQTLDGDAPLTGRLVLADGTVIAGQGLGATGSAVGEVCFNTAITGYQEILTDPSYAGQIITFTFPHIGNVGTNPEDTETSNLAMRSGVRGCVLRAEVTEPSNYRAAEHLDQWLKARGIIAITGVDTRALTARIREKGMPNGVIAHEPSGKFDLDKLKAEAKAWPGLDGMDLVPEVTAGQSYTWDETRWVWGKGYGRQENARPPRRRRRLRPQAQHPALPRDGRLQGDGGAGQRRAPRRSWSASPTACSCPTAPAIRRRPASTRCPRSRSWSASGLPVFGICLGHQMLGLALGAKTKKMHQGHHGANHPVKDFTTGKVEITSMNHGFAVDRETLPADAEETHVSLFDGSNCGLRLKGKPVFSVQYHPEASPGPQDSHYLFTRFVNLMREQKGLPAKPEGDR